MTNNVPESFKEVKDKAEESYSNFGEVWCPYLQEKIVFNAKGKEHLKFKAKYRARSNLDQYVRFQLLKYAPEVIKKSHTVQGLSRTRSFEVMRSNHKNEQILVDVAYFEFVAIVAEKTRVRIVVKQIGSSQPYFWSIIPFWKKSPADGRKQINYGNPEED